jgi:demethylmenaquinone methyltransferase/2-methoxy-6-polyprenyl-1,4-benzoquinol methylase
VVAVSLKKKPGGRVVCLESTQAEAGLGKHFHDLWLGRIVPLLGWAVTGDPSAYAYLPASVAAFPRSAELSAVTAPAGLVNVRDRRLGLGAVALHVGEVPV